MKAINWSTVCPNCLGNPAKVESLNEVLGLAEFPHFSGLCWYCEGTGQDAFSIPKYLSLLESADYKHYGLSFKIDQEIARRLSISTWSEEPLTNAMNRVPWPTPESQNMLTVCYHESIFSKIPDILPDPQAVVPARVDYILKQELRFGLRRVATSCYPWLEPKIHVRLIFSFLVQTYQFELFVLKSRLAETKVLLQQWKDKPDADGNMVSTMCDETTRTFIYE